MDCLQPRKLEAYTDRKGSRVQANERDVEVSRTIAQSIVFRIKGDQRHDDDIGSHGNSIAWNGNTVHPGIHFGTRCPTKEFQRLARTNDKGQRGYPSFALKPFQQRTKINRAFEGPIRAEWLRWKRIEDL